MKSILFAILTDADARQDQQVAARLREDFSAGSPWYNKAEQ
jgi:hypothetical protein